MINSWVSKKNSRFCWFDHFGMCETWGALETLAKVGMVTVLRASQCQRNHVGKDGVGIVMWKWSLWSSTHDYTHTHIPHHIFRTGDLAVHAYFSPSFQNWWYLDFQNLEYQYISSSNMFSWYDLPGILFHLVSGDFLACRIWPAMAASWARISWGPETNGSVTSEKNNL